VLVCCATKDPLASAPIDAMRRIEQPAHQDRAVPHDGNHGVVNDTPDSDPRASDASGGVPTAAEAFGRLDMPLVEAMMTQRAVRRVLPDPVDDALVLKCIELALRAPTGANGQNWEFIVVKDRRVKEKLARRYRQAWKLYYGMVIRRAAARDESMAKIARAVQWQVDHFTEIPVHVVACLRLGVREGRVPYTPMPQPVASGYFGSIYPSVQNLLLAARAMGLGASLITLPLWSVTSARRTLNLPLSVTPCCIVSLGWPQGRYGPTTRKPVDQVTHLDAYGNRAWLDSRCSE
jgi:nitroreductase